MYPVVLKRQQSPFRMIGVGLVLALILMTQSAAAQTTPIGAPTGTDDGDCTVAASPCQTVGFAIDESVDGDTIELTAGEYTENLTISDLELNIRGAGDGVGGSILQGHPDSADEAADRVIAISVGSDVTIEGVWIRHGNVTGSGGGIRAANASALTLIDSTVSDNLASGGGGGIEFDSTDLSIRGSRIIGNRASGTNAFNHGGGGIRAGIGSTIVLIDSTIDGNLGVVHSGGIRVNGSSRSPSTLTVDRSTISNNATDAGTQAGNGGGIFADGAVDLLVSNSTLSGNSGGNGAAIFFPVTVAGTRRLTLINSTITNNLARSDNGAVRLPGAASTTISNTIIADQQSPAVDCNNPGGSIGHNLSSDSSCGFTEAGDLQNANAALGPLADNGGPTRTHTLLAGSAAIGAGDTDVCAAAPIGGVDQRDEARGTEACAIGAVEAAPAEPPEPDPAPAVLGIDPDSGPVAGGTAVTITGSNFQGGATVSLGEGACTGVVVVDAATITCATPPAPEGPVDVVVGNPDGQSDALVDGYTYTDESGPDPEPILSITGVDPDRGPETGGTAMRISGSGFQAGAVVGIGNSPCLTVAVVDDTTIECSTPAGPAGPADVSVTNPDHDQVVLPDGFLYLPDDEEEDTVEALPVPLLDRPGLVLLILLILGAAVIRARV